MPLSSPDAGANRRGRIFVLPNPAAGAEFVMTVPTGRRWRVRSLRGTLTTSATVATRTVGLLIDDGTSVTQFVIAGAGQAASLSRAYNFGTHLTLETAFDIQLNIRIPMSDHILEAGFRILSSTNNLQPGDQWTGIVSNSEEETVT